MNGVRFIFLLLLTFLAMGFATNASSWLMWIENHPGLASWVQALGSIAAIVAAIGIASHQNARMRRDRVIAGVDRYLEMFAAPLALSEAAVREYRGLYDTLFAEDFAFDLGFGRIPKRMNDDIDAITESFAEIRAASMPTVDSINCVRALRRLVLLAKAGLSELMDLSHRDPDRPYAVKQAKFLALLGEIATERIKLRRELVRITNPDYIE